MYFYESAPMLTCCVSKLKATEESRNFLHQHDGRTKKDCDGNGPLIKNTSHAIPQPGNVL